MPTVKVINFKGELIGEENLSDVVFAAPVHVPAMHQVVVAQQANARQGTHSTRSRGEVQGGGRKPWRQKHTGRARHGSRRSPLWVGGGVTHGPRPRDYHQKVNRKVRRIALKSALSLKVLEGNLVLLDRLEIEKPDTKGMASFLAEIDGDHVCMDGGVEAFVQTKEPAVLVTNRDYYAQYADVLMDKTVVYENEKYLYISNDL